MLIRLSSIGRLCLSGVLWKWWFMLFVLVSSLLNCFGLIVIMIDRLIVDYSE